MAQKISEEQFGSLGTRVSAQPQKATQHTAEFVSVGTQLANYGRCAVLVQR